MSLKEIREALESVQLDTPKEIAKPNGFFTKWEPNPTYEKIEKALPLLDELEKENEWQPIETAPTDRDILVLCANGFIMVAGWHFKRKEWYNPTCAKGRCSLLPITHWKPLPQPPKQGDK